jgi:hypothetical protein
LALTGIIKQKRCARPKEGHILAEVIPLFSDDVAEEISLRQMEAWLVSPDFPERPPPEIASILSEMREAPSAESLGSQSQPGSRKVIPLFRKPPAA